MSLNNSTRKMRLGVPLSRRSALLCGLAGLLGSGASGTQANADEKWPSEQAAGPFFCHADFSLDDFKGLVKELSYLQTDMQASLGIELPEEKIHLFLFEKKATYQAYLKRYFPTVPSRPALYIKDRQRPGMLFACQGVDFEVDVRHEATHAILHANLRDVPLWVDEGLAEYYEMPRDKRSDGNPHLQTIRQLLRQNELPRLDELESLRDISEMRREHYRDAWAWMHFCLHGSREAYTELVNLLKDAKKEEDLTPLSLRLRSRIPDLEAKLVRHFRP